jgi:ApbE superfamily uncharacterized protein (UPF0280 family)
MRPTARFLSGDRLHLQHGPSDLIIWAESPRDEAYPAVAQRMHDACLPFASTGYLTRMAAVAGSVADEVLAAICQNADISRFYVNNCGDIALYLAPGTPSGAICRPRVMICGSARAA